MEEERRQSIEPATHLVAGVGSGADRGLRSTDHHFTNGHPGEWDGGSVNPPHTR